MEPIKITRDNFEVEVLCSDKPVLLDFWASWCGPCRQVLPILDEIAAERSDIKVCKINVDDERELAKTFNVTNIPMVAFVKNNTFADVSIGFVPKEELVKLLEANK